MNNENLTSGTVREPTPQEWSEFVRRSSRDDFAIGRDQAKRRRGLAVIPADAFDPAEVLELSEESGGVLLVRYQVLPWADIRGAQGPQGRKDFAAWGLGQVLAFAIPEAARGAFLVARRRRWRVMVIGKLNLLRYQ
jgi:hypothetical protein